MAGGYDAVAWRVLKSLATYVAFDIYVAKDWACATGPRRHPAIRRNQRSPNYARRRKKKPGHLAAVSHKSAITQGSAATTFKVLCDLQRIFSDVYITNSLLSFAAKDFRRSINIWTRAYWRLFSYFDSHRSMA